VKWENHLRVRNSFEEGGREKEEHFPLELLEVVA
jgi:hypothetical protein